MKLITIWIPLFLSQRIRFQRKGSPHSSVISCNYKKNMPFSSMKFNPLNYNEFWVTYIKYYHNYKVCVSFRLFDQCNIYLASFTYFLSFFPFFCFGFFFSFFFSWGGRGRLLYLSWLLQTGGIASDTPRGLRSVKLRLPWLSLKTVS